jgi:signal transduction histidine kinase
MIHKRPPVRLRVSLLVLVPLAFLTSLTAYDVISSASSAHALIRSKTMLTTLGPPVARLQQALTAERTLAVVYFAQPAPDVLLALRHREAVTDHAVAQVTAAMQTSAVRQDASAGGKAAIAGLRKDLAGLAAVRAGSASHSITGQKAFAAYSGMIAASYQVLEQAIIQDGNSTQVLPKIAIIELAISNEYVQQESALLNGDFADRSFPASAYQAFASLVGAHRLLYAQSYSYLNGADRSGLNRDVSPRVARTVTALENRLVARGPQHGPPPVRPATWNKQVATLSAQVQGAVEQALARLIVEARSQANATLRGLYLTAGVGLAVVIVSLILSLWIAVSLARQLRRLRDMALELANDRLPMLVRRLGAGEDVEVAPQVPVITPGTDEIGQVETAFLTAERMAVEATIDQARMRRGIGEVFRNLARRSQSLLARQMMLIDALERRAAGPDDLENLYRIDHLTTRMRRHAESLIVLAGDLPGRTFVDPVPFVDVLRAAAAEVEDYTRVRVVARSSAALAGLAVADVIHMLAELIENATSFSPPTADVRVTGSQASRGYAIDIEDRGLGMTGQELADANARLTEPPMFDLTGSDRLGLHVASQLARRHGIRITLRDSPYGGTTAIVLIPMELVIPHDSPPGDAVLAVSAGPESESGDGRISAGLLVPAGRHSATNGALAESGPIDSGPALPAAPVPTAAAAVPAPAPAAWSALDGLPAAWTENGLPVRVRQKDIAPSLREDPVLPAAAGPETDSRSPDAARRMMSAFWQGRTRGLSEAEHESNGVGLPQEGGTQ